ncbi:MAG TPA: exodeoxyribonuclease VII large subunit [Chloroflexota bacterium]|nr:exodeoxyribonuclease VII large subunit [Chloroflexota bacterium]
MTAESRIVPRQSVMPRKVLQVAELTRYVKRVIDDDAKLSGISVLGEVANISRPGSGHIYFTLKDATSQLACVMMRAQALRQTTELTKLQLGINTIAEGSLTVYEPRGGYQLSVQRVEVQGAGAAQIRFERLRQKLESEGLFSEARKRPIPSHPRSLALITAPQSQAYHDVIKRLQEQWPRVTVIVAGVTVQGEGAPAEIALALDIVNRMTKADAILIVRGGGSPEELGAFNDERVARAIFASRIPVITGIGHTQDWTIADYVADLRATTPTAAAAIAVPDGLALRRSCRQLHAHMRTNFQRGLSAHRNHLVQTERALVRASPVNRIAMRRQHLDDLWSGLTKSTTAELQTRRRRLDALTRQMEALNPLGILSRGYALLTDAQTGQVVASVSQANSGRHLTARVKDGSFPVTIGERH